MSDSMTNVEIEDVLSSIRRLVAEGDKIKQDKKREYGDVKPPVERLVLTSAHRVEADKELASDEDLAGLETVEPVGFEFVAADEAETSSVTSEEAVEVKPSATIETLVLKNGQNANARESLEATIAALEAAVEGDADEFEPDGSEMKATPAWGDAKLSAFASRRDSFGQETDETSDQTNAVNSAQEDTNAEAVLDPAILKPESRVFRVIPDTPPIEDDLDIEPAEQPADEAASDAAPQGIELEDKAANTRTIHAIEQDEDYGDEMLGDESRAIAADDNMEVALTSDLLMDEEVMRRLVSEVLKGELEGKLGDTITRNVRKLVRREIHRVLTHQELE